MKRFVWLVFILVVIMAGSNQTVLAQTDESGRFFLAGKAGANILSAEDGESGASFGGGFAAGYFFTPRWAIEFEWWMPAYVETDHNKIRDILYSISAIYRWEREQIRPYLLIGYSYAQVQQAGYPNGSYSYVQAGFGVEIKLNRHFSIAPEFRSNFWASSVVLRPCVSLMVNF